MEQSKEKSNPFALSGEGALITGGGTGIGFAIAKAMVDAGASVVITGRRQHVLEEAVTALGGQSNFICADVTNADDRTMMLAQAPKLLGRTVSILVNNAGQRQRNPAVDVTDAEFDSLLETHVNSVFSLSRDAAKEMLAVGRGTVLFIASVTSFIGVPEMVGYTTAKTAILGLSRALAAEWSPLGIRVNAIAPGWISTPMTREAWAANPERKADVESRIMMGHPGTPEDIGYAAVYLASPAGAYVTGQALLVDGGAAVAF